MVVSTTVYMAVGKTRTDVDSSTALPLSLQLSIFSPPTTFSPRRVLSIESSSLLISKHPVIIKLSSQITHTT